MKTLDRHQLESMGFNPPEGPYVSNGRIFRFFILRSKPWLGIEEYLPDRAHPSESEAYAVNYGTHLLKPIQSMEDIQYFIYEQHG